MFLELARAGAAAALLAFVPGYFWTRLLLPGLSRIERFVVSVVLSIALVTFVLYAGNRFLDVRISGANAVIAALAAAGIPAAILLGRRLARPVNGSG